MSMPVKNLMTSHVISVNAIDTASHAFDIISNKNISGLAVSADPEEYKVEC